MPRLLNGLERRASRYLALALVAAFAACGPSEPSRLAAPTPTPHIQRLSNPIWRVPPSIEEQVFRATVIVRASLQSATAVVETVPSGTGVAPTYRPAQELRFTAHEYLKGSGPTTLLVVVRARHTYLTAAEARADASYAVAQRVTAWDDRQGVLFLETPEPPYTPPAASGEASGTASTTALEFTQSNWGLPPWDYSVDTLSRAWLPAREAGGAGGASGASDPVFITDGAESPPPVVSLTDLRTQIAATAAELRVGQGIEGFTDCVLTRIGHARHRRAEPWTPFQEAANLVSGSAAGTEVYRETMAYREPRYSRWWLSGPNPERFQARIIDDDDQSGNGYDHALVIARPLPAGAYRVHYNWQYSSEIPCHFVPEDTYRDWTVTVTAPAGTVHEAFFDPVAIGNGVGADSSNGALEPTAFTVGGTAVTLQGLSWEARQLHLELSAAVSLADHYLDVIALDGSVALRLSLDDATTAAIDGGQAWRWRACTSPWTAGDQLMLRLHHSATELSDVTTHPGCGPAPTYGAASYAFSVAEDAAVAAAVRAVAATGTGDDAVSYAITAGNDAGAFAINASTGAITVAGTLDYETTTSYSLTVQAVQATSLPATVSVAITITDAAEPPTFGESSYAFSVAEDAAVGAAVGTVTATARANGAVSFALTAGNAAGAFALDASTGAITVAGALDYETTTSYMLTVTASHGVSTTTVPVAVTVTDVDEPPTFGAASYAFSVAEDAAAGAAVGTVKATGTGDAAVSHSLTAGNAAGAFALDASTGAITVAGALDYETTTSYTLTVQAVQGASDPAAVSVAITITDVAEPPTFGATSYTFSVAEDAAVAAAVGTVTATARANGAVSFAITAGNDDGAFAINASTGAITVAGALDYETTTSYTLTVTASHGASTTTMSVAVTVTNVVEPLAFGAASYAFAVAEDAAAGAAVGTVAARSEATVSHAITAGNAAGAFAIDASTGALTVAGTLDHETTGSYALTVTATDGTSTATAAVTVTVTNVVEPPVFGAASYAFRVAENVGIPTTVGTVTATDPEGGTELYYDITGGNEALVFAVDALAGRVVVGVFLDYEATASYTLTVRAVDGEGDAGTVTVTVTVTDVAEPPAFGAASHAFSIAEDAAAGAAVGTVAATVRANGAVSYALTAGNTGDAFAIDADTGAITVAGTLDHATTSSYPLTVTASHGVSTTTVTVTITVTEAE